MFPDDPNYMTFLLSRNTYGISDGGVFTIGMFFSMQNYLGADIVLPSRERRRELHCNSSATSAHCSQSCP